MAYYYLETDGRVYLIEERGRLAFPQERQQLPCEVEVLRQIEIAGEKVLYCKPLIDYYPRDWQHKDLIPSLDRAQPLVRLAVHTSLPRVVTEALIPGEAGQLLLVKASRGFNAGQWTLPGGFVGYGETPEQATEREVGEEIGVPCQLKRFLGLESFFGSQSYSMWYMFFYEVELRGMVFRPAPDEIAEIGWFPLAAALAQLQGVKRKVVQAFYLASAP